MTSKLKTDVLETGSGSGTIALNNQLSGMTAASMPSGSVLQVKTFTTNTTGYVTSTSASYVDSDLVLTITPTSTSSKILITAELGSQTQADVFNYCGIFRDGTQIGSDYIFRNADYMVFQLHMETVDSPSTTSELTYRIKAKVSSGTFYVHHASRNNTLTLTEIKG